MCQDIVDTQPSSGAGNSWSDRGQAPKEDPLRVEHPDVVVGDQKGHRLALNRRPMPMWKSFD